MAPRHNVTINSTDRSTILYQGDWQSGSFDDQNHTPHTYAYSFDTEANFTVTTPPIFAFYYFGSPYKDMLNQICVDCDPRNRVWEDIVIDPGKFGNALYSKQWNDAGSHEIIVTNRKFGGPGAISQITLNDLVFTTSDDGSDVPKSSTVTSNTQAPNESSTPATSNTVTAPNGTTSSNGNGSIPPSVTSTASSQTTVQNTSNTHTTSDATSTATTSPTSGKGNRNNVHIPVIVGGVVGGIFLVFGSFFL